MPHHKAFKDNRLFLHASPAALLIYIHQNKAPCCGGDRITFTNYAITIDERIKIP
jgi:hypothetical protein